MSNQQQENQQGLADVGIIGLGIMGSWYARHMLDAGLTVCGFDPAEERQKMFQAAGGRPCASPGAVIDGAAVILTALSSIAAFRSVMLGPQAAAAMARTGQIFVELGTLPIDLKEAARLQLQQLGAVMIDAPVTGTSLHAERKELIIYASGDHGAFASVAGLLQTFALDVRFVGPFGTGMKLKMVTNHLVAIHNIATAEALSFAASAGLDLQLVYDLIAGGPASSAVFGFRAPLMIAGRYVPPTMRLDVFSKDLDIISDFSSELGAAMPMFEAGSQIYRQAIDQGLDGEDVAATFKLLRIASRAQR
jgi:3-hydroxyisobutyrate dehydrogenase-like beta-hydroxyacid dehydrogenase